MESNLENINIKSLDFDLILELQDLGKNPSKIEEIKRKVDFILQDLINFNGTNEELKLNIEEIKKMLTKIERFYFVIQIKAIIEQSQLKHFQLACK